MTIVKIQRTSNSVNALYRYEDQLGVRKCVLGSTEVPIEVKHWMNSDLVMYAEGTWDPQTHRWQIHHRINRKVKTW